MDRSTSLERAKQKVNAIKRFYHHLALFVFLSAVLLASKGGLVEWVKENSANPDKEFLKWVDWNILAIPIIWGVVIVVQGCYAFGFFLDEKRRSTTKN